ncbi:hypothetical protein SmJEL517_g06137 [Synchytrium microbalum]|uniref:TOG domain-containing protein n=1 Tax=Synchytrium microbalum TaxID=1806994 RepID=A0A507BS02_9FUNG|nr:uncharacterized protein SmJEL517_g06137 [Synchytrium microbalum]TPX30268.1 hypothetical protein SmJEL517_g06137 [Synchytrium microbalum]
MASPIEFFIHASAGNNLDKKIETIESLERSLQSSPNIVESYQIESLTESLSRALKSPQTRLSQTALSVICLVLRTLPAPPPLKTIIPILLPTMVERLSDSKERVRELATTGLVELYNLAWNHAMHTGVGAADSMVGYVERVIKTEGFGHKTPRGREQSIIWLQECANAIPEFPVKTFIPALVKLLEDAQEGVRSTSRDVIISIYNTSRTLQHDIRKEFGKKTVRPAVIEAVQSHLVDLAGGSTDQLASESKLRKPSSSSTSQLPILPHPPETPMKGITSAPSGGGTAAPEPDPIMVSSVRELDAEIATITSFFKQKETEENWEDRDVALQKIRGLCRGGIAELEACGPSIKALLDPMVKSAQSLRTALVMSSFICISDLATYLGPLIDHIAEPLVIALIKNTAAAKKLVATAACQSLNTVLKNTSYSFRNLSHVMAALSDKNAAVRGYAAISAKLLIEECMKTELHRSSFERSGGLDFVEKALKKGLGDASAPVREASRDILLMLLQVWPDRIDSLIDTLDPATKKAVARSKSAVGKGFSLASQSGPPPISRSASVRSPSSPTHRSARIDSTSTPAPPRTVSATITKSSPTSHIAATPIPVRVHVDRFIDRFTSGDVRDRQAAVDEAVTSLTAHPISFPSPKASILSVGNALISLMSDPDAKVSTRACNSKALDVLIDHGVTTVEDMVAICVPLAANNRVGPSAYLDHIGRVYPADVNLASLVSILAVPVAAKTPSKIAKRASSVSLAWEQDTKIEVIKRAGNIVCDKYKRDEINSYFSDAANARLWITRLVPVLNAIRTDCEGACDVLELIQACNPVVFDKCLSTFDESVQTYLLELFPSLVPEQQEDDEAEDTKVEVEEGDRIELMNDANYDDGEQDSERTPTRVKINHDQIGTTIKPKLELGSFKHLVAGTQSSIATPPHNGGSNTFNLLDDPIDWSPPGDDDDDDGDDSNPFGSDDDGLMDETAPDDFADVSMSRNSVIISSSRPSTTASSIPTEDVLNGLMESTLSISPPITNRSSSSDIELLPPSQPASRPSLILDPTPKSSVPINAQSKPPAGLVGLQTSQDPARSSIIDQSRSRLNGVLNERFLFDGATPTPARPKSSDYERILPALLSQLRAGEADRDCARRLLRIIRSVPSSVDDSNDIVSSPVGSRVNTLWSSWGSEFVDSLVSGLKKGISDMTMSETLLILLSDMLDRHSSSFIGREKNVLDVLIACRTVKNDQVCGGAETALRSFARHLDPLVCMEACFGLFDDVELYPTSGGPTTSVNEIQNRPAQSGFHALILVISNLKNAIPDVWTSKLVDLAVRAMSSPETQIRKCAVEVLAEMQKHIGETALWRLLDGRVKPDLKKLVSLYADKRSFTQSV